MATETSYHEIKGDMDDTPWGSSPATANDPVEEIKEELVDDNDQRSEVKAKPLERIPAEKRKALDEHDDAPGMKTTVRNTSNQTDGDDSAMTLDHDLATTRNAEQQRHFEEEVRRAARFLKSGAPMSSVDDGVRNLEKSFVDEAALKMKCQRNKLDIDDVKDMIRESRGSHRTTQPGMLSLAMKTSTEDSYILAKVLMGVDLTEVFSPVRVARVCIQYGLRSGSAFDLSNGWDFGKQAGWDKAMRTIDEEEPCL